MNTLTKLLLAAMGIAFIAFVWWYNGLPSAADKRYAELDTLHKEVIRQNSIERYRMMIRNDDLRRAKRADSLRYSHRDDSMKLVVSRLSRKAYGVTRFIPAPGTPCDTAVTLRDSIITAQEWMLVEDSVHIMGLNTKFDSAQADFAKLDRLSEESNRQWEEIYRASEKRNAEIDRKWRRKRRVERVIEIGGVVLIVIAVL
jgi:hypothetical protein